ncbi:MAG TPA: RNA polymerase sigma factor SigJ [Euzebyales bacterium]|nr:RNA polymerase sigma factor SigJ [Euzebyales bacterium]
MDAEALIASERPRLFGIAYRMLGEAGEAEDAVQETFLRWSQADWAEVDNPAGWLTTVLARICLDRLKSAQHRRETYVGPWLPEPIATDTLDPADDAALADSLSLAFLVVLERLSPLERAAFLLHDVFGYAHDEVAAMLERTPAAVRQVAARARGHLAAERPRYERDAARREAVTEAFVEAVDGADLDALMDVLAPDVVFVADGGGIVAAARHPQHGADRVAQVIISLARLKPPDWTLGARELNGEPGFTVHRPDGTIDSAWVLHAIGHRVVRIDVLRNPAKLAGLEPSEPN